MPEENNGITHYKLAASNQKRKRMKDSSYKEKSKKSISSIVNTKMKTSFIGAISAFEKHFGFLWGHGKDEEDLTPSEAEMREVWEETRADILDNGNTQLRAIVSEINNYTITWDRYHLDFPVKLEEEK